MSQEATASIVSGTDRVLKRPLGELIVSGTNRVLKRPLDELKGRAPSVDDMIADARFQDSEHARGAAHEEAVGVAWDREFGHCFPDLMAPEDDATIAEEAEVQCIEGHVDNPIEIN
jgi:hypothetical protein